MLVKLTCRGRDFPTAVARARRGIAEFRIRGVSTNIPFLQAVLDDPDFQAGRITTSFIDERPQLLTARASADRGTKILNYLADVTVNQPHGTRPSTVYPHDKLPEIDLDVAPPAGSKQRLVELGPEGFARWLRESPAVRRHRHHVPRRPPVAAGHPGAHQRIWLVVAPYLARTMPQLLSVECWGGATYDVALRFLKEDPWERLATLREAMPNICLQMLLRGRNTVGYTPYPELVTSAFVEEATATGIDIFRIFDALNNVESMRPAIDAVRETGTAIAEVAMCYTGDLSDPGEHALHAGLLPEAGRADRRRRRARAGHQGHGRSAAAPGRDDAGRRAAQPLRPAGARAHPRHTRRPAGHATWPPGRPGPTPSTAPPRRWREPPASPR